jgi:hypothetical protein
LPPSPLVMVAVGLTLGLVLDRYAAISLPLVVLGLLAGLAGLARAVQLRRDPPVIYPVCWRPWPSGPRTIMPGRTCTRLMRLAGWSATRPC